MRPRLHRTAKSLRRALDTGKGAVGFVPTMGALHEGHLSLVRRALKENGRVVVSIFVNPTQFGEAEDFSRYPRTLREDLALLAGLGPVLVYAPEVGDVYPEGFSTTVRVGGGLGSLLEAAARPGHFEGVATVVTRLFSLVRPDSAYFGLKDYQQFQVVRRFTDDLGLPVRLVGCPIVREDDGLAMSSRNRRLSADERAKSTALVRALLATAAKAWAGEASPARLRKAGLAVLEATPGLRVEYFEIADPSTLRPIRRLEAPALALVAARLGGTRLIDNMAILPAPAARRAAARKRHA